MTVFRNNPLLMTVMGANPGPRRKRPVDDPIDHAIGQAWHRLMSGVQVSVMDIPRIFRDVKLEMAAGMSLEEAVMRVGARFQVNRNPSLAASLAGGLAGAFVTHAMSNPGPSFIVIETATGNVVYTKRATGMGTAAIDACFVKANYLSQKTGRAYIVFLDIRGLRVGMRVNVPMVRALGITGEILPRPNPLTSPEMAEMRGRERFYIGRSQKYEQEGKWADAAHFRGAAQESRHVRERYHAPGTRFEPNPVGVVFSTPAKLEAEKIAGWMNRAKGVRVRVEPMRGEWGVKVPPHKFAVARRAFDRAIRMNPKANPDRAPGKRKVTMTIEQFARWVKAKRDPVMWKAFLAKFKGYEKWTHGAKSRKVVLEWQNVPGMDGLWITYDGGKQPESTYIMRKGSPRKGAWKHEWDTMPDIKHDPEAGLVLNKLRGKSKISDFYHR